jgi:hypothetical protein
MIQNVLRALGGIDHYGVVSLLLFATIFAGVIVYTCVQKKPHLDRMAHAPLENDSEDPIQR